MFIKWKLMLTTLVLVGIVLGAKIALDQYGFVGPIEFGDIGTVITGGIFVLGFMLAGTMADFKESEKIPGELACALETIEETFSQACASKPAALNRKELVSAVASCADTIRGWLCRTIPQAQMYQSIEQVTELAHTLEPAGVPAPLTARTINEIGGLRKIVTRIGVISRTDFLSTGYALIEALVVLVIALLLLGKFKGIVHEYFLISFVAFIYIYLIRLIKDVDDPFEYSSTGAPTGAAEVALFPLDEYRERLAKKLQRLG